MDIKVAQGAIFKNRIKWDFGWFLAGWQYWQKKLGQFFFLSIFTMPFIDIPKRTLHFKNERWSVGITLWKSQAVLVAKTFKTIVHLLRCIARVRIRASTACPILPEKTWCGPFLQFLNKITNLIKFLQRKLDLISSYTYLPPKCTFLTCTYHDL